MRWMASLILGHALFLVPRLGVAASSESTGVPRISPETAIARAVNELESIDGGFVLHHPRHTMTFTDQGVRLDPRRGPSWSWRLSELSVVGESPIAAGPQSGPVAASSSRTEDRLSVTYTRGAVEERYLFGDEQVEQQFVLSAPLSASDADLIIRGQIACAGSFEQTGQGWLWRDASGVVSLGDVKVYDADGRVLAADMNVDAGGTEIRIDGVELRDAVYPVTIDPEIGTNDFRISDAGPDGDITYDGQSAAIAYNSVNNQYLVVWEGDDNVGGLVDGEFEIFGQRIDAATGAELGTNDFRISDVGPNGDTTYDAVTPAVAYNSVNNEYLVVWSGEETGLANGEFEIFGQRVAGATGLEAGTNDFRLSDMGPDGDPLFDAAEPDVAYNATQNEYVVVWSGDDNTGLLVDEEAEIFGQRVAGATGAQVGTNDFRISDMGADGNVNYDAEAPAVCYAAPRSEYLVVWSGDDNTGLLINGEFEAFGQRLNASTGAEVGTNDFRISDMGPDGNDTYDAQDPAVSYASAENRYLVVWSGDDNIAPLVEGEREIFGQLIDATTGLESGSNDTRLSAMGQDGDPKWDARAPSIGYNPARGEFFVSWSGDDKGGGLDAGEFEIFGQRVVASSGAQIGADDFVLSNMGRPGFTNVGAAAPVVAVKPSGTPEFMVAWQADQDTLGLVDDEFEIYGQRIVASSGNEIGTDDARYSDMGPDGDIDFDARSAQLAYNQDRNEYLVVWEGDDNIAPLVEGETEIFGQIIDASSGAELALNDFRISDMGPDGDPSYDAQKPAAAYNQVNHEYLVVWSGEDNAGGMIRGEFEIFGQRIDAATGAELGTNDFRISDMGPNGSDLYDALSPAVIHNAIDNQYLVVWEGDDNTAPLVDGETEIFGQRLSGASGAEIGANDIRLSDMGPNGDGGFDALLPSIAHNSTNNEYLIVWAGEDNSGLLVSGEFEIFGQRLSSAGVELGTNDARLSDMGPDGDPLFDAFAPALAYDELDNQYLVVWQGQNNIGVLAAGETEIWGQRLSGAGAELGVNDFRLSDMGPDGDGTFDAVSPSVAYNRGSGEYLVVWEGDDDTSPVVNGENEIWGQRVTAASGAEVGTNDFRLSDVGADGDGFSDASVPAVAYARNANQYLVVWHGDEISGGLGADEFEIYGQRFANVTPTGVDAPSTSAIGVSLHLSPNPAHARTTISLASAQPALARITVLDVTGRARMKLELNLNGAAVFDLDTAMLPAGVYLVRADTPAATATSKLIVTR